MEFREKTLNKNHVFKGRILNLRRDDVLLPNGNTSIREIIEHNGGSAVLCIKDNKVLLVKQFRYAYGKEIWEIPAGKINLNEDPMQTAFREIEEECGVKAESLELLYVLYPSPGYTEEKVYVYKAINLSKGKVNLDEDEFLSSHWIEIEKVKEMIKNGEICDAKTLVALLSQLK